MRLKYLSLLNYKNIRQAELTFSPKLNCFIGNNGEGKTNLLDAVYYLSFCKSATNPIDSQNILHGEPFFMIQGEYSAKNEEVEEIYCGLKQGQKKQFKRNKKEYKRLLEHIGLIPLVLISPYDIVLIGGGSEERRRFMDVVISQYDRDYLEALVKYNKAMVQRNALLKLDHEPDVDLLNLWEEIMANEGTLIYEKRKDFIAAIQPLFNSFYQTISQHKENVTLTYTSHCQRGELLSTIQAQRGKSRAIGYSLHGVHKDDLEMHIEGYPIRKEGSQGQNKSYLIALKLAQFIFLKQVSSENTPILLLDDIFDKLDRNRVEQIVKLVSGEDFGQIFITDTNREHLDQILCNSEGDYKLFQVINGEINCINSEKFN